MNLKFLNVCAALGILALTVYVLIIGQKQPFREFPSFSFRAKHSYQVNQLQTWE